MSNDTVVRVERGNANPEELAAVTAILLARTAATGRPATSTGHQLPPAFRGYLPPKASLARRGQPRSIAGWRRLERQTGFRAPHSWQG
jgi:hypothetical protein